MKTAKHKAIESYIKMGRGRKQIVYHFRPVIARAAYDLLLASGRKHILQDPDVIINYELNRLLKEFIKRPVTKRK